MVFASAEFVVISCIPWHSIIFIVVVESNNLCTRLAGRCPHASWIKYGLYVTTDRYIKVDWTERMTCCGTRVQIGQSSLSQVFKKKKTGLLPGVHEPINRSGSPRRIICQHKLHMTAPVEPRSHKSVVSDATTRRRPSYLVESTRRAGVTD